MKSPLHCILMDANEQFEVYVFFLFSNVFIYLFFIFIITQLVGWLFIFLSVNRNFSIMFTEVYLFIKGTVKNNITTVGFYLSSYTPYFFILFLFILISNLTGIFTFGYTITSLLVVPFFFSFINFIFTSTLMLRKYGLLTLAGFLPNNTSLTIAPLLIIIEIISYFIKLISLAVRLFANMFAGHILIKVLLSLAWVLLLINSFLAAILAFLITSLIAAILCLELFICALQAYVFINLASVYLDQALNFLAH